MRYLVTSAGSERGARSHDAGSHLADDGGARCREPERSDAEEEDRDDNFDEGDASAGSSHAVMLAADHHASGILVERSSSNAFSRFYGSYGCWLVAGSG